MKAITTTLLTTLTLLSAAPALACDCMDEQDIARDFKDSRWVFVGKPVAVQEMDLWDDEFDETTDRLYTFEVVKGYKGNVRKTVRVQADAITSCSEKFDMNRAYVVWLTEVSDQTKFRMVTPCSRTKSGSKAKPDVRWLEANAKSAK